MSAGTASILEFAEKVSRNNDLQRQLKAIEPGDQTAFLELAHSQGYSFSSEELQEVVRETSFMATSEKEELTEDQLEQVNGGLVVIAIIAVLIAPLLPAVQKEGMPKKK